MLNQASQPKKEDPGTKSLNNGADARARDSPFSPKFIALPLSLSLLLIHLYHLCLLSMPSSWLLILRIAYL